MRGFESWTKMPSRWVREGGLRIFTGRELATSVAALKLYLLVVASAGRMSSMGPGRSRMTYTEFTEGAGIPRALVRAALDLLSPLVESTGRSCYSVKGYPSDREGGWCLMPAKHLMAVGALHAIGEGRETLHALKLYHLLLERRDVQTNLASIGYELISRDAGVRRSEIPAAIQALQTHQLVQVIQGRSLASKQARGHNRYIIKGLPALPTTDSQTGTTAGGEVSLA